MISSPATTNIIGGTTTLTKQHQLSTKPLGQLDYFDLDHSNPPPICINTTTAASKLPTSISSSSSSGSLTNLTNIRLSTVGTSITGAILSQTSAPIANSETVNVTSSTHSSTLPIASSSINTSDFSNHFNLNTKYGNDSPGIVYKSVDFVKTEAFKRTRLAAELNRAAQID